MKQALAAVAAMAVLVAGLPAKTVAEPSPEPRASPVMKTGRGWPRTTAGPAGAYSWPVRAGEWSWMHKVPDDWGKAGPNSVELTFYGSEPDDRVSLIHHAWSFSDDVDTEMRLLEVGGTMVAIVLDWFPATKPALVDEARAVIDSIVAVPTDGGHVLVFELEAGWDSG